MVDPTTLARPVAARFGGAVWQDLALREDWIVQPKLDGWRCMVDRGAGSVRLWSRHGKPICAREQGLEALTSSLARLPEGTVLDGEIVRGKGFWAFDCIAWGGDDMRAASLERRLYRLRDVKKVCAGVGTIYGQALGKAEFYHNALRAGHEGVVLKCLSAPYPPTDGAKWIKVKPGVM